MRKGLLIRDHKYAYIQYGEDAAGGADVARQGEAGKRCERVCSPFS